MTRLPLFYLYLAAVLGTSIAAETLDVRFVPLVALDVSPDGSCGNGYTCIGYTEGQCCSEHGYCGDDAVYCGAGCNPAFGRCGGGSSPSPAGTSCPAQGTPLTITETVCRSTVTATQWVTATTAGGSSAARTVTVTATVTSTRVETRTIISAPSAPTTPLPPTSRPASPTATATRTSNRSGYTTIHPQPSTAAVPSPHLPGVVNNCQKWYKIVTGDNCQRIARAQNITREQLWSWNPSLAPNSGQGLTLCNRRNPLPPAGKGMCRVPCNDLWPDYYICVGA